MSEPTQEFQFSEDLIALRDRVREFCQEMSPESAVRSAMESESGYDAALWRRLGSELGVFGLAVPESLGGDDAGLVAQAILFEEMGAALVCGPVIGTLALAVPALCALSDIGAAAPHLAGAMSGDTVLTLAAPIGDGVFVAEDATVSATTSEGTWTLHGVATHVADGMAADAALIAARTSDGIALFLVDTADPGLTRTALTTMDLTRRQAQYELKDVVGVRLADEIETPAVCEYAARVGAVLIAAEQVGGSQAMLDRTVDHAKNRLQFGQAIGAFQAVKHKCADMLMAVEQARSVAYHGAWAIQDDTDDPRLAASLARAVASETYFRTTATAIQLHGGTGFTWEYPAHLYFKRAVADSAVLGSAERHYELIAEQALDAPVVGAV